MTITKRREAFVLSKEAHEARRKCIGGSDAKIIMEANPEDVNRLWREKRGEAEPEDLSGNLYVCFGTATEDLNKYWFERNLEMEITRDGEHVVSKERPFMGCTLDGFVEQTQAVFEAKTVSGFEPIERIIRRYTPQLCHNMYVTGVDRSYLSVLIGTGKWECHEVRQDEEYLGKMLAREADFWDCVQSGKQPALEPAPAPEVAISNMRVVDMQGNNSWAVAADIFVNTKESSEQHEQAKKDLKSLVDPDVREASGHGIRVSRDRGNKMRIKVLT